MNEAYSRRILEGYREHIPFVDNSSEMTQVYSQPSDIISSALAILQRITRSHDLCLDRWGPSAILGTQVVKSAFESVANRGAKIRLITEVSRENLDHCKEFSSFAEVRHLDRVMGNFSISDTRWYTASAVTEKDKPPARLIVSNVKEIAEQHQYFFETLWDKGLSLQERIRELEEGHVTGDISVLRNPDDVLEIYRKLLLGAKHEIMILFPSQRSVSRQAGAGIFEVLEEALSKRKGSLKIRLIAPYQATTGRHRKRLFHGLLERKNQDVSIRSVGEVHTGTKATVVVVDSTAALMMEQRDDFAESFNGAIGLSTLSESQPGVMSYASIFESLWVQTELYDQVKLANEQLELAYERLKEQDKMQREFINIAAHELRTPVQPLLGMADILAAECSENEKVSVTKEDLDLIIRNSKRLERLSSDILQVTRIESNRLELHRERININDEIRNAIKDLRNGLSSSGRHLQIKFDACADPIEVEADRSRIFEVLSNLLDNASKFSTDGALIHVGSELAGSEAEPNKEVIVNVIDSGSGIDKEIIPKLFMKFATKSDRGTGLGLYISKSIIQAHGGKIWAENNLDKRGARFSFSLPLAGS
jgi:signal transduction histidine kinase